MNIADNYNMEGYLSVYREYPDGTRETVFEEEKNVITMKARRHHLSFLKDKNATPDILTSFKVGTGGTLDVAGKLPRNPDANRPGLYEELTGINTEITLSDSDPADATQVYLQVIFSLNQNEGRGSDINECALFKESGEVFNIKTFRSIPKTDAFSLIFDWKIRYV